MPDYPNLKVFVSDEELIHLKEETKEFFELLLKNLNKSFFDMLLYKLNVDLTKSFLE